MNDNKKKLSYSPDIKYEEDYYSDGAKKLDDDDDLNYHEESYDDSIMDHIQDNIDHLAQFIPMLPIEIQTAVNQVFKPVFNDWYLNLKGNHYPSYIPEPGKTIIKPKPEDDPDEDEEEEEDPNDEDEEDGSNDDDDDDDDYDDDDDDGNDDDTKPGPGFEWDPPSWPQPEEKDPIIFIPEINDPIIGTIPPDPENKLPIDDDVFAPSSPFVIEYVEIDPVKLVELEYVKNCADVYLHYTRKLRKAIDRFIFNCLNAIISSNNKTGRNDAEKFLLSDLTLADAKVTEDARHLIDTAVRGEVNGLIRLNFSINVFTLESTLYHLKNYKVTKNLRARYEAEEMHADGTREGSKSDRMLSGLRQQYDKNYDTSYINLYKHLNSSVAVLEDALNTLLLAIASKEILFKDGGSKE